MSQFLDEFSHPEPHIPLYHPKGRGKDQCSPGSEWEIFVQASKPAAGTNMVCLSSQAGFPVGFAAGQQLPCKVLLLVMFIGCCAEGTTQRHLSCVASPGSSSSGSALIWDKGLGFSCYFSGVHSILVRCHWDVFIIHQLIQDSKAERKH